MGKATLEYTLPDEESEFRAALQGMSAKLVLWSFDTYLRNRLKYCDDSMTQETHDALQAARDELRSMCEEHHVSLDE